MYKFSVFLVVLLIVGCQTITAISPPLVKGPIAADCPAGRRLVANVWSYQLLPYVIQEKVVELMKIAKGRNTRNATDPAGYREDAVSPTLGSRLRSEVRIRAPVSLSVQIFYRDLQTARIVEDLGVIRLTNGAGSVMLPDDPRKWIVETVWPDNFMSPIKSGGGHRLWLFGYEWKQWCVMNVHGIVP